MGVDVSKENDEAVLTSVVGRVLVITLNRPHVKNAIDSAMSKGVVAALAKLDADGQLRAGVITGSGGAFCAGMDLKAFATDGIPQGIDGAFLNGCQKPLVAAIEGVALGGGLEMALMADLMVGATNARIGITEVKFGLFPGGGALLRLPYYLPQSIVTQMAMTGQPLTAEEAYQHGLIVQMCEPGDALEAGLALATTIAGNAPLGVAAIKSLLRTAPGRPLDEMWVMQRELVDKVFHSDDAREGARAFAEKRPPEWQGR
jgi:enoyl-CoA hydratase